jgi:hypothetical protein
MCLFLDCLSPCVFVSCAIPSISCNFSQVCFWFLCTVLFLNSFLHVPFCTYLYTQRQRD